jgi:hypothetical protein
MPAPHLESGLYKGERNLYQAARGRSPVNASMPSTDPERDTVRASSQSGEALIAGTHAWSTAILPIRQRFHQ